MMETEGPMYRRVTRDPAPVIFPADYQFKIGPGVLFRDGAAGGLKGTGVATVRGLEAADLLAAEGIALRRLPDGELRVESAMGQVSPCNGRPSGRTLVRPGSPA